MKIKEVHVAGFGCLKELALKFGDSINVILAPNDEGKSTLQCFITAILYPFSDTKERERFKPWTANTYGGRLTYLLSSGKEFIIHKMIRERASKDELKLYGSEEGKEVDKDLLDTHLGMNSETFTGISIIRQLQVAEIGDQRIKKSVMDKIRSIAATGTEELSLQKALKKLNDRKDEIGVRDTGETKIGGRLKGELDKLEKEYQDVYSAHKELEKTLHEIKALKREITELKDMERKFYYLVKKAKFLELKDKLDRLNLLKTREKELTQCATIGTDDVRKLRNLEDKIKSFKISESSAKQHYELICKNLDALKKKIKVYQLCHPVGAIAFVISAILTIWLPNWILLIGGLIGAIGLATYIRQRMDRYTLQKYVNDREQIKNEIFSSMDEIVNAYKETNLKLPKKAKELKKDIGIEYMIEDINTYIKEYEKNKVHLFKSTRCNTYEEIENKLRELENIRIEKKNLMDWLGHLNANDLKREESELNVLIEENPSFKEFEVKKDKLPFYETNYEETRKLLAQKENALTEKETRKDEKLKGKRTLPAIEVDLDIIKKKYDKLKRYREALNLAEALLNEANKKVYKAVQPELNSFLTKKIAAISNGRYPETKMDDNLDLRVKSGNIGVYIDSEVLGGGMQAALYILLRVGILEALTRKNKEVPPLIMDEAFNSFDDFGENRLESMFSLLCDIVKENAQLQVIYFTCQKRGQYEPMKNILKSKFNNIEEECIGNFEIVRAGIPKVKTTPKKKKKKKAEPLSLF